MAQLTQFYVTPSTSTYLVKQLSTQTVLYFSTNNTSYSFNVRDITGLSSIQQKPAVLSTIGGAIFIDGTTSYFLNQPLGFVNMSLRNSNQWQIKHTSGQAPAESAANLVNLNVSTINISFISTTFARVSSYFVSDLFTAIIVPNGPFTLETISTAKSANIAYALNVSHDVFVKNNVYVGREVNIQGSMDVQAISTINNPLRIYSSLGVGGSLVVMDHINVLSTLHVRSDVFNISVQVQRSTGTVYALNKYMQMSGILSTLNTLESSDIFIGSNSATIQQDVSSIQGIFSTQNVTANKDVWVRQNISTSGNAQFFSTVSFIGNLEVAKNFSINSTFATVSSLFTNALSTPSLSTFQSLTTNGFINVPSTFYIQSNLSATTLLANQLFSTQNGLFTNGFVSSYQTSYLRSTVSVLNSSIIGSFYLSDFLVMGNNTKVFSTLTASSIHVKGSVHAEQSVEITQQALMQKSTGVRTDVYVDTNATITGPFFVSSYRVQSFSLSNLDIMTSSPFTSFTTSSMAGTAAYAGFTKIIGLANNTLSVPTVFASTIQTKITNFTNFLMNEYQGQGFQLGSFNTESISDPSFAITEKTLFAKAFSTSFIKVQNATADLFSSIVLSGDGKFLSNYPFPYSTISGTTAIASTVLVSSLVSRSLTTFSSQNVSTLNIFSSLITDVLRIDGTGNPPLSTVNQMLMLGANNMTINSALYFDRINNYVGIGISTPQYDLDVSGTIYAEAIVYSSLSGPMNTSPTVYFSSITPTATAIRDVLEIGTQGLRVFYKSQTPFPCTLHIYPSTTFRQAKLRQVQAPFDPQLFSMVDRSTINLSFSLFVDSQKHVGIGSDPTNSDVDLSVGFANRSKENVGLFTTLQASTVATQNPLRFSRIIMPDLVFFSTVETPAPSTNTISSAGTKLFLNYPVLTAKKAAGLGILTTDPAVELDVMGNVYLSSLQSSNIYVNELFLTNFQTL